MSVSKSDIFVYAHWVGMPEPLLIGTLTAQIGKGRKAFLFKYD